MVLRFIKIIIHDGALPFIFFLFFVIHALYLKQLCVTASLGHQLIMGTLLRDFPMLHEDDPVTETGTG